VRLPALIAVVVLAGPTVAQASGSGGVAPGSVTPQGSNGGTAPGSVVAPKHPRRAPGPRVESFSITPDSTFIYGRPAMVRFVVKAHARRIHLALVIKRVGSHAVVRRVDLGQRPTGRREHYLLAGVEGGPLPQGNFDVHLSARGLRGAAKAAFTGHFNFHWHMFPLVGNFTYGLSADGRFGAKRKGHTHEGQDIPAPLGTPVIAPRAGVVKFIGFQKSGAGHYVVMHGEGEDLDFAFMHLRTHSILVHQGQTVATGQQLATVGATGDATGPHLHFEIWKGAWEQGGVPLDPLPFLRRWDAWS
jgi:murein DD-endopeptidase MepM/ murein hydrolase activator NlpD